MTYSTSGANDSAATFHPAVSGNGDGADRSDRAERGIAITYCAPQDVVAQITDAIARLQSSDSLRPVWIVCPGVASARALSFRVASVRPLANVSFLSPSDALTRFAARVTQEPDVDARRPLSDEVLRELMRQRLDAGVPTRLKHCNRLDLVDTFCQLYRDVETRNNIALEELATSSQFTAELIAICKDVQSRAAIMHNTPESLADYAIAALHNADLNDCHIPAFIWFVCAPLEPYVQHFVEAIGSHTPVEMLAVLAGDELLDTDIEMSLLGLGVVRSRPKSVALRHIDNVIIAPDAVIEVDLAIERMLAAAELGTPFSEMALLFTSVETYASIVIERMEAACIPFVGRSFRRLSQFAVARFVKALLRLFSNPDDREGVIEVIQCAPLRLPDGTRAATDFWLEHARNHRYRGGVSDWRVAIARDRAMTSASAASTGSTTSTILHEFDDFLAVLEEVCRRHPKTWAGWVDTISALVSRCLGDITVSTGWPHDEIIAAQALDEIWLALSSLDEVTAFSASTARASSDDSGHQPPYNLGDITLAVFRSAFEAACQRQTLPSPHSDGVFVGLFSEAVGTPLRLLALCGLNDGRFPRPMPTDALRAAFFAPDDISSRDTQLREVAYVVGMADTVIASAARADLRIGQPLTLSPWLLDAAARLAGAPTLSQDELLETHDEWPWHACVPSAAAVTDPHRAEVFHATWLQQLVSHFRRTQLHRAESGENTACERGKPVSELIPEVAHAWCLLRARTGSAFSEFDGDLRRATARLHGLLSHDYSPTSLENWAKCPFRFFLSHVLNVSQREKTDPEERSESPLDLGSALHEVLERYIRDDCATPYDIPSEAQIGTRVATAIDDVFAARIKGGTFYSGVFLDAVKQRWLCDLTAFLKCDYEWRASHGVWPVAVEVSFGAETGFETPMTTKNHIQVMFHGHIDRIDRNRTGDRVIVTDYKTKEFDKLTVKAQHADDDFACGTRLQLDVYGLAAKVMFPNADLVAGYWSLRDRTKGFRRSDVVLDDDRQERFRSLVDQIVRVLHDGVFPQVPRPFGKKEGTENCQWCAYTTVCPSFKERAWELKRTDDALADYRMIEEGCYDG